MSLDAARASSRAVWADVAKGACIVLVVLHHVVTKQYVDLVPAHLAPLGDAWNALTQWLKPVRMPLFFVISGLFASGAVHRPWPAVARRALAPYYLYVVWLLVLGGVFAVERTLPMNRTQGLGELALDLVLASTGLWFLYALAVYFVLVKLTVRLPAGGVLGAALVLALLASLLPIEEANRVSVLVHLAYFALGARCPDLVRRVADSGARVWLPELTAAYVVASLTVAQLGLSVSQEVLVLSLLGVPWGILLAVRVASTRAARPLAWLGRRTLTVYVLHMPVLACVHHLGPGPALLDGRAGLLWALLHPLLVTALVVGGSLALRPALTALGLGLLFRLPGQPAAAGAGTSGRTGSPNSTSSSARSSSML